MSGRPWTQQEQDTLRRMYPEWTAEEIAPNLGRTVKAVQMQAKLLGLRKSREWVVERARAFAKMDARIKRTQFQRGIVPWNKGQRHPTTGRARETQFKAGTVNGRAAQLYKPVGSLRIKDGLLERKVSDGRPTHKRWIPVQRLVWEAAHGEVPRGMVVAFRRGMHTTTETEITPDRLELITRAELMERNTVHRYPREVKAAMHAIGKLRRAIHQRSQGHEEPNAGPA